MSRTLRPQTALLAAAALLCLASSLRAGNFAVLVGVDYTPAAEKWAADATNVRTALINTGQWPAANIITISGGADVGVTKAGVLAALAGLSGTVTANDAFLFYYSGHGSYVLEPASMEMVPPAANPCDETLHLTNGAVIGAAGRITDDELTSALGAFNAGAKKLAFLDSCFSGGFWNGQDPLFAGDLELLNNSSLIAASGENETAPGSSAITNNWIADMAINKFDLMNLNGGQLLNTFNRINPAGGAVVPQQKSPPGFPVPNSSNPDPYNPVGNPRSVITPGGRIFTNLPVPEPATLTAALPMLLALGYARRRLA